MRNPLAAALEMQSAPSRGAYGGGSSYAGAAHTRLTSDWIFASIQSADQEIRYDLRELRARSRELVRNNDTASRYVGLVEEQAIGHEGIRLQAQVNRPDGKLDSGINQQIEDAWTEWCDVGTCTVDGQEHFVGVQSLVAQSIPQDGEALVRMLPWRGNRFGFALQLLDPDQLDHEYNRAPGNGAAEIRMGVEIDRVGRRLAYHIWDHHPSEYSARGRERQRIPADQIIHLGRGRRVNQTRFIPWFTPGLLKLHMLAGYEEAELVASRSGAAKGGFYTVEPEAVGDPNAPNTNQEIEIDVEPGSYDRLPPGWGYVERDPKHPTDAFKDFQKAMLRGVANALGVSYTSLANDLEDVNFSSIRAGLLNERDAWRRFQWWLVRGFLRPVYREWLRWSLTTGALELPQRNVSRWYRHRWQPRGWPWVDPLKDMQAAAIAIRLGLDSRTRLAGEAGRDFEDVIADQATEEAIATAYGITLTTDVSRGGSSTSDRSNPGDEEDEADALASQVLPALEARYGRSRIAAALTNGNGRHA